MRKINKFNFIFIIFMLTFFTLPLLYPSYAAQFSVNPHRFDPYKKFKFRVKWDGKYIPGICKVSGLKRSTSVVSHREGGEPNIVRKSPGLTALEPIVLVRGRTHDDEFEKWANKVWSYGRGSGSEIALADFRKDIIIDFFNEAGQIVMSFKVYRCWPSEYVAVGELVAKDSAVAVESITLEHEGWERDTAVTEPQEPSSSGK
jgi:phage tail-like protein